MDDHIYPPVMAAEAKKAMRRPNRSEMRPQKGAPNNMPKNEIDATVDSQKPFMDHSFCTAGKRYVTVVTFSFGA